MTHHYWLKLILQYCTVFNYGYFALGRMRSHLTGRNRRRTAPGIHSKANLFQEVEPDLTAVKREASYASRSMHAGGGELEYHCSDCPEVFTDQIVMLRHIRRVHLNRTRYAPSSTLLVQTVRYMQSSCLFIIHIRTREFIVNVVSDFVDSAVRFVDARSAIATITTSI